MARPFNTKRIVSVTGLTIAGVVIGATPAWSADSATQDNPVLNHACHLISGGQGIAGGALQATGPAGAKAAPGLSADAPRQECSDAAFDFGYDL